MEIGIFPIVLAIANLLLAVALAAQWWLNRGTPGLGWWASAQTCLAVGILLGDLREQTVMGHLAVPISHGLLILTPMLFYVGLMRFFSRRERWWPVVALVVVVLCVSSFYTFVLDSTTVRGSVLHLAQAIGFAMASFVAFRLRQSAVGSAANFVGAVFALTAVLYLLTAVLQGVTRPVVSPTYTDSIGYNLGYLVFLALAFLWTFGLVFLVNRVLSAAVREDANTLRQVFEASPDAVAISRLRDGVIIMVNQGFSDLSGYSRAEAVEGRITSLDLWSDPEQRKQAVAELRQEGVCRELHGRLARKDGSMVDCVFNARVLPIGDDTHVVTMTRDVSAEVAMQEQLRLDATTDSLTGVANRRSFLERAEEALVAAQRAEQSLAVAVADLDDFKTINDNFGHACGDEALLALAREMTNGLPDHALLGRLGGDEFAVVLPGVDDDAAAALLDGLRVRVETQSVCPADRAVFITISVGVSASRGPEETIGRMLARADAALYKAKAAGKNRVATA